MTLAKSHLLLIGGGHAHVAVLADWVRKGLPCQRATLLTPSPTLRYSGMVPGWIAGQYDKDAGTVDVAALAERAGAELVLGRCIGIDPNTRVAATEASETVPFEVASIDTGGIGRASQVLGDDPRLMDIRPIDHFVERMAQLPPHGRIAVIGGGAGGTELALALRNWHRRTPRPTVTFVTGSPGLLPEFSEPVRKRVASELAAQGITVIEADAQLDAGTLTAGGQTFEPIDLIVAALGSAAPSWPRASGLSVDDDGFIAVDRNQRSISHSHIFAVGDVASRQDVFVPHSGVHAVHSGPVLAANLRAVMAGRSAIHIYLPRLHDLYLMSTGNGGAIASYGRFSAEGRWVARLKHWIDNRWISKYARLAHGE